MRAEPEILRATLYSAAFTRVGWVMNPLESTVTPRWAALGTAELVVPPDHPYSGRLAEKGCRAVIELNTSWDVDDVDAAPTWVHLVGGPVRGLTVEGVGAAQRLTARVEDDWRLLARVLGWQVPGSAIGAQSGAEYDVVTGPAETVVKTLVTANAVTRLGLPVTVAPDLGRGAEITTSLRMHPLVDRLYSAVDQAGIGVTVTQSGDGLLVDVREPVVHSRVMTVASGAMRSATLDRAAPTATRAVGGGQGEGTDREFRSLVDSARESQWGDVIEVFVDARDTADPAELDARLAQALADGAPRSGISLTLADTPSLRYGRDLLVGDTVSVDIDGQTYTDTLRSARLTWDPSAGLQVVPQIGERSDDPDEQLGRLIGRVLRDQRDLARR